LFHRIIFPQEIRIHDKGRQIRNASAWVNIHAWMIFSVNKMHNALIAESRRLRCWQTS